MRNRVKVRIDKPRNKSYPGDGSQIYGSFNAVGGKYENYYPDSILKFSNALQTEKKHPTQKPVELFQYLIKTYSNPGATVLDCFAGSGTAAIAAYNTGRNFICIEQDFNYWQKAAKRLQDAQRQMRFDAMVG